MHVRQTRPTRSLTREHPQEPVKTSRAQGGHRHQRLLPPSRRFFPQFLTGCSDSPCRAPLEGQLPRGTTPLCPPGVDAPAPHALRHAPTPLGGRGLHLAASAPTEQGPRCPGSARGRCGPAEPFLTLTNGGETGLNHFGSGLLSFQKAAHKRLYEISPETLPPDIVPRKRSV